MATLVTQIVSQLSGITDLTFVTGNTGGDKVQCADNVFIVFKNNSGGAARTVTVNRRLNCKFAVDHDSATTVANTKMGIDGPFPIAEFDDGTGYAGISYDVAADISIAAVRIRG